MEQQESKLETKLSKEELLKLLGQRNAQLSAEKIRREKAEAQAKQDANLTTLQASKDLWRGAHPLKERPDNVELTPTATALSETDVLKATVAEALAGVK